MSGPTIRLRPGPLRITFDPRGQASLGSAGTVMANVAWEGGGGAAAGAPGGALVSADWTGLRLPLDGAALRAGVLPRAAAWSGRGWRLVLPSGWAAAPEGTSWVLTPPAAPPAR